MVKNNQKVKKINSFFANIFEDSCLSISKSISIRKTP